MPPTDTYRTLTAAGAAEPPKTLGSRFLGLAHPAADDAAVAAVLADVRRREPQATHWCWAARLGVPEGTPRTSDDGEPSGSAGLPILREIDRRGLTDTLVVVTRYYGGTKLGTGGLARAYGEAAGAALDAATAGERVVRRRVTLAFAFADTSAAMRTVGRFDAVVAGQQHAADGTRLDLDVRASEADALATAFVDATAGRGTVTRESDAALASRR